MYRKVLIAALIGGALTAPGHAITAARTTRMQTHPSVLPSLLLKRYYAVQSVRTKRCWVSSTKPDGTTKISIGSDGGFPTSALAQHEVVFGCYTGGRVSLL
jgi:hypothetical protein